MSAKTMEVKQAFLDALSKIENMEDLEKIRVEYIGKKGYVTELLKEMKSLQGLRIFNDYMKRPQAERPQAWK